MCEGVNAIDSTFVAAYIHSATLVGILLEYTDTALPTFNFNNI
jgi:hypothetical protein